MDPYSLEKVYALLDTDRLPGDVRQLRKLCIRIHDLAELNGEDWVVQHREKLIKEWQYALEKGLVQ